MKWLNEQWQPSLQWTLEDRVELASALLELVERDVYADRYGLPGRPNFTSVATVLRGSAVDLENARESVYEALKMARSERRG